jgi:hypothetical protein
MLSIIIYFAVVGIVFIPLCISASLRRCMARFRADRKPLPRFRERILPSDEWCEAVRKWRD